MENAAGDGRLRGRTGRVRVGEWGWCEEGGRRGNDAQLDARTSECTGNIVTSLDDDFDDDTASMCVG